MCRTKKVDAHIEKPHTQNIFLLLFLILLKQRLMCLFLERIMRVCKQGYIVMASESQKLKQVEHVIRLVRLGHENIYPLNQFIIRLNWLCRLQYTSLTFPFHLTLNPFDHICRFWTKKYG